MGQGIWYEQNKRRVWMGNITKSVLSIPAWLLVMYITPVHAAPISRMEFTSSMNPVGSGARALGMGVGGRGSGRCDRTGDR